MNVFFQLLFVLNFLPGVYLETGHNPLAGDIHTCGVEGCLHHSFSKGPPAIIDFDDYSITCKYFDHQSKEPLLPKRDIRKNINSRKVSIFYFLLPFYIDIPPPFNFIV